MDKKILITGGSGNSARYIAEEFTRINYDVTLFDCITPMQVPVPWKTELQFVKGDLLSLADCMRAITLSKAETIIHFGAVPFSTDMQPGERRTQTLPEDETMRVNVMGTYYIMDAARRLGVKKVIMGSSVSMLGHGFRISDKPFVVEYLPIDENHPNRPEGTYSLSKLLGEEILKAYSRAYGIKTVAFRLMGIKMPHNADSYKCDVTPEANPGHKGGPIDTTYQYVDVRDVAQACVLAAENDSLDDFEAFFLDTDNVFGEDTRLIVERLYPDIRDMAVSLKGKEGIISTKKVREKLGYRPKYSWRKSE